VTPARQAIVDILEAVPEIGVVHAYERYASDHARLKTLYFSAPHAAIRGWFVRRTAVRETGIHGPRYTQIESWQLRGFLALDDDGQSELVAEDLIEAIRDRFRAEPTLDGNVVKLGLYGDTRDRGLQLVDFSPAMFCGVLCHSIRFDLTTSTERTLT
jgi:hypothetical protein